MSNNFSNDPNNNLNPDPNTDPNQDRKNDPKTPPNSPKNNQLPLSLPWLLVLISVGCAVFLYTEKQAPTLTEKPTANLEAQNAPAAVQPVDPDAWQPPKAEIAPETKLPDTPAPINSYHQAVAKAAQSVVNIYTTQKVSGHPYMDDPMLKRFFEFYGGNPPQQEKGATDLGSGVIISEDGYIVTNAHVIDKAEDIVVAFNDGQKSHAKIIGVDPESDLAVIKVDLTGLTPLAFRQEPIQVGDVALAIGNPFGVGQTVTQGIISATGRTGLGVSMFEDFIQTDAAINPGNSGGALVDANGALVGINTLIFSRSGGSMGIGFAIPTSIVEQVMNGLIKNGRVSRGWLGIEVQSKLKDPTQIDNTTGVEVDNVFANSPAEKSGLQKGDIILSLNGVELKDAHALIQYVAKKTPNTQLVAQILRNNQPMTLNITLDERPTNQDGKISITPSNGRDAQNGTSRPLTKDEQQKIQRELMEMLGDIR